VAGFVVLGLLAGAVPAQAAPFTLDAVLTGDPRPDSPDGLSVLVNILVDGNVATFTVDLDMAEEHPKARLDEFGFNLLAPSSQYSMGNFSLPYTPIWNNLNGSGGAQFLLTLNDPNGNKSDATNITSLSFTVTKTSAFTLADFTDAPLSCSSNSLLGCNQLAVHLQALGADGEDSGVATGNYPGVTPVPEPGTLTLLGFSAVAAALARRRREAPAR
jgi:hypothetical protein